MLRDRTNYREVPLAPDNRVTGYLYQRRIRTRNGVVRLNKEIRPRSRAVSIFADRKFCLWLVMALTHEQSEERIGADKRYLDMQKPVKPVE
jgi:transposase-like protein